MRLLTLIFFAFSVTTCCVETVSAQSYTASLDGLQQVPPTPSPATGIGTFSLDGAKILSYNISFSGLVGIEILAHIHAGPAGQNGSVVITLPMGSPKVGVFGPLTPEQEAQLNSDGWYVNIHSDQYPSGEIRGQIILESVPVDPTVPLMSGRVLILLVALLAVLAGAFITARRTAFEA